MNFAGLSEADQNQNVISLFGNNSLPERHNELFSEFQDDFDLEIDLDEEEEETITENSAPRILVTSSQFPDQSMFTLDKQLLEIKENIERLKFYLSDLKDSLPM